MTVGQHRIYIGSVVSFLLQTVCWEMSLPSFLRIGVSLDLAGSFLANVEVLCSTGVMSLVSTVTVVQTLVCHVLSVTEPSITYLT